MSKKIDFYLLSMPTRVIDRPALSMPTLAAELETKEISYKQKDFNIEIYDYLLSENVLTILKTDIIPFLIKINTNGKNMYYKYKEFFNYLWYVDEKYSFTEIEKTKKLMNKRKYEVLINGTYIEHLKCIFKLFDYFTEYCNTIIYYFEFFINEDFFEPISMEVKKLCTEINLENPLLVGLSVIEVQRIFSLWFADMLKNKFDYKGKIIFGGSDVSLNYEKYIQHNSFIDFACYSDGESTIPVLMNKIKDNLDDYESVVNLVFLKNNKIVKTELEEKLRLNKYVPTYNGIDLNKYLLPTLQILTSKGCEWSNCKFCMHWNSYGKNFRQTDVKSIVDEIEQLKNKYKTNFFIFVDESISAKYGYELAKEIIKRGLNIKWIQMSRLDSNYNLEIFETMFQAGCRVVEWGLESASQEVLNDINKGINVNEVQRIIHCAAKAGIINKMLMFHNYPTETVEDLMLSINCIKKNTLSRMIKPMLTLRHEFVLKKGSPLANVAFKKTSEFEKYFKKVWYPNSDYSINAKYIGSNDDFRIIKKYIVKAYLDEMRDFLDKNKVYITNNSNLTLDIVLYDLLERGKKLPVDVYQPYSKIE